MFKKILIANRGEIACRIIKTAQRMGIETVAVYSTIDAKSLHVSLADEAFFIGESKAHLSYLNIDAIIRAAKQSGAEAIHPGYGFLSENPLFAKACADADLIFIGPSIESMLAMSSKQLAKQRLESTKVPLTPGYHGQDQSDKTLLTQAKKIGFPILLKAANGGGGKGMREVHQLDEFTEALAAARRESKAYFSDDTIIIEKLICNPRHIEVQIMADNHGHIVHLFERDCSLQRRHQKIIEEAPAPHLDSKLRKKIAEAACEVARSIDYRGAGTIEFLVDSSNQFYFMEMNTRLQVEHPVTECITNLDLVEWQLRIAANEPLPCLQKQITERGHAIECRIYAEDPENNFMPSIGQIHYFKLPPLEGLRLDSGVTQGSSISQYYDPMIAKLIAYGATREEAIHRLNQGLSQFAIGGIKTNIPFLRSIINTPTFIQAKITTDFLSHTSIPSQSPDPHQALLLAMAFDYLKHQTDLRDPLWQSAFAWQLMGRGYWFERYTIADGSQTIRINPINPHEFSYAVLTGEIQDLIGNSLSTATRDDERVSVHRADDKLIIHHDGVTSHALVQDFENQLHCYFPEGVLTVKRTGFDSDRPKDTAANHGLTAPMPATIVALLKQKGDSVKQGDRLVILEAMKMEHTIHAPKDGVLSEIFYSVGSQVAEGAALVALS